VIRVLRADPSKTGSVTLTWESSDGCDVIDGFIVLSQAATIPTQMLQPEQVDCSDRCEINASRRAKYSLYYFDKNIFVLNKHLQTHSIILYLLA